MCGGAKGVNRLRPLEQAHIGLSGRPLECVELAHSLNHEELGGAGDLAQDLLALHVAGVGVFSGNISRLIEVS